MVTGKTSMKTVVELIRGDTDDKGIVPLTSLDIYEGIYAIGFAFFFRNSLDEKSLKASLVKTLKEFPVLTGRLRNDKRKGQQYVHCNDHGLRFTVAHSVMPMADYGPANHAKDISRRFIDDIVPWKVKNRNYPLATIKLTHMQGGGSVLGVSILHSIADGESYFHFIDSWARTHRGLPFEPPCHDRMLLENEMALENYPRHHRGFRVLSRSGMLRSAVQFLRSKRSIHSEIIHFTRGELDNMKKAASRSDTGETQRISTNDALCGHLWQVMASLKDKDKDRRRLLFVANIRKKCHPPLPEHFFGNASLHMILDLDHETLVRAPLSQVAAISRKQVNAIDQGAINEQMAWLRHRFRKGELLRVFADYDPFRDDLFISSDAPYNGYGADFGSGAPFWITIGTYPVPWSLLFMPDSTRKEGIDVHTHLSGPMMRKFMSPEIQHALHRHRSELINY
ncbi:MAG: hypothetical protein CVV44_21705 [Spirochaetae bacterium HGW-Spirochaetae-1]|nr:MAG: hypothetical protein CVV44_21705 [Spirochaetae bacterium HGW-Spirochaetae-1]